jgi:uncharacterized protein DUF3579
MPEAAVVEFVIQRTTRTASRFVRRCVVVDVRLEQIEPMGYGFLLNFAKDNELRDGRVAERTSLAEMQRLGDTA